MKVKKYVKMNLSLDQYGQIHISDRALTGFIYNGKIYLDRKDCWNKISQCPIQLALPETREQLDYLKRKIRWLKTKDGYRVSSLIEFEEFVTEYDSPEIITPRKVKD